MKPPEFYVRTARRLTAPVGRLDALLVPLAAGGSDSHGGNVCRDAAELRERLVERLGEAKVAIEAALNDLADNFHKS